jgi:8-oxo-dGTP diphosphatase
VSGRRRTRTRVAAYGLCRDEVDRVLLCRIAESIAPGGIWTLPGGGLDFGESPPVAALRELTEETGLVGEVVELIDVFDRVVEQRGGIRLHSIQIVYRARIVGGELRDEVGGSTDRCAWFSVDEAYQLRLGAMARRTIEHDETVRGAGGRVAPGTPLAAADQPGAS